MEDSKAQKGVSGSAMIFLIALITFSMIGSLVLMRLITQAGDIATMRYTAMCHEYATEAIILYALAWCKEHQKELEQIVAHRSSYTIYKGPWNWHSNVPWQAHSTIISEKRLRIRAELYAKQECIGLQECSIELTKNEQGIAIRDWLFM